MRHPLFPVEIAKIFPPKSTIASAEVDLMKCTITKTQKRA